MATNPRHDGKPLLRLLEFYVLQVIDELPEQERQTLERLSPKLRAVYGGNGEWHEAVAAAVRMPADMPAAIREIWTKNLEIARANNVTLHPQQFAEIFVDRNFAGRSFSQPESA